MDQGLIVNVVRKGVSAGEPFTRTLSARAIAHDPVARDAVDNVREFQSWAHAHGVADHRIAGPFQITLDRLMGAQALSGLAFGYKRGPFLHLARSPMTVGHEMGHRLVAETLPGVDTVVLSEHLADTIGMSFARHVEPRARSTWMMGSDVSARPDISWAGSRDMEHPDSATVDQALAYAASVKHPGYVMSYNIGGPLSRAFVSLTDKVGDDIASRILLQAVDHELPAIASARRRPPIPSSVEDSLEWGLDPANWDLSAGAIRNRHFEAAAALVRAARHHGTEATQATEDAFRGVGALPDS